MKVIILVFRTLFYVFNLGDATLPEPPGSGFRSGLMPFMIQMDSMTSLTRAGGFCMDFTRVMSDGFKVSRADSAASRAGIASAKSPSQSS